MVAESSLSIPSYNETVSVLLIAVGLFMLFGRTSRPDGSNTQFGRNATGALMLVTGIAWWAVMT